MGDATSCIPNATGCRVHGGGLATGGGCASGARLGRGGWLWLVRVDDFDALYVGIDAANGDFFATDERFVFVEAPSGLRAARAVRGPNGCWNQDDSVCQTARDRDREVSLLVDLSVGAPVHAVDFESHAGGEALEKPRLG